MGKVHRLKPLAWSLLAVLLAVLGATAIVRAFKKPGQMTVLEGMNMDTQAMGSATGMTPVAVESVRLAPFEAKVTYTGSILPFAEQSVSPRVEGYLRDFSVYAGDSVRAGQLLVRIEAPDLGRKVAEAQYGSATAQRDVAVSQAEVARLGRERLAMVAEVAHSNKEREIDEAELLAAQSELQGTRSQQRAAQQGVREARNMLQVKQAAVKQAVPQATTAQANLAYWQAEIRRIKALVAQGAASVQEGQSEQAQYDTAAAAYEAAQANVTQMQAEVAAADARVAEAEAAASAAVAAVANREAMVRASRLKIESGTAAVEVARRKADAAQAMVDKSRQEVGQRESMARRSQAEVATARTFENFRNIVAPFSGKVTRRLVSPGSLVGPSTAILTVAQLDRVRLQANVADSDLARIRMGAPVRASIDGGRHWISARVTSVFPQADPTSRTAVVEAIVANPAGRRREARGRSPGRSGWGLIPGKYVVMEISTTARREQLTVPSPAIVQRENAAYVWVALPAKDRMFTSSLRKVSLGATDGHRTVVTSGLQPGDRVIYAGQESLKEGDMVTPAAWTETGPRELSRPMPGREMPGMPGMEGMGDRMPGTAPPSPPSPPPSSAGSHASSSHEDMPGMPGMEMPAGSAHPPSGDRQAMPGMPGMGGGQAGHAHHGGR